MLDVLLSGDKNISIYLCEWIYVCLCASVTPTWSINESVTTEEEDVSDDDEEPKEKKTKKEREKKIEIYILNLRFSFRFFPLILNHFLN
jgi:hypothetical protein